MILKFMEILVIKPSIISFNIDGVHFNDLMLLDKKILLLEQDIIVHNLL